MLVKYNLRKDDPLVADYNADNASFGAGECATFFMGDWMWTVLGTLENKDTEYGYIPVPWSNDPTVIWQHRSGCFHAQGDVRRRIPEHARAAGSRRGAAQVDAHLRRRAGVLHPGRFLHAVQQCTQGCRLQQP